MSKKIVQVCPYYWPHRGGVETHLLEVNKVLVEKGYEVSVITEQFDRTLPRIEKKQGVKIYRFPTFSKDKRQKNFFSKLRYKKNIFSQMIQYWNIFQAADVIQIHDIFWWILPLYPFFRSKIYCTFHGWEGIYPVPWKNKVQRRMYNRLARGVVHVGSWIKEFYGDEPNTVVYGGSPEKISPIKVFPSEHGMNHKPYTFVFIGRLEAENEVPHYIQLIKELTTTVFKPRVLWVGDGKYKKACEKIGKVTGFKADVSNYIHRGKIILASSYLSILEAQAYGKVVCAFYSNPLKKAYLKSFPGAQLMILGGSVAEMKERIQVPLSASPAQLLKKGKVIQAFARTQTWKKVTAEYEWLWQV